MSGMAGLEQRFDALQPRERLLASVAIGVLLALFVYLLWVEPAAKAAAEQQAQIETLAPQVAAEREALARVNEELARDPEAARRLLLEQLRSEAAEIDARVRADQASLILPARMPGVLRDLLGRDARLRVLGVEAQAPEVLRWTPAPVAAENAAAASTPADASAPTPGPGADVPALYRHRVVLRFEADFAATLDYVRAVEALPLRVRLEDLEVDASRWPRLVITLQVETLGLDEGWIGV
jgi:MSHA biogenesis protein MshJ